MAGEPLDVAALNELCRAWNPPVDIVRGLREDEIMQDFPMFDLPSIIVVGEQSAGKSSVMEAISRIRFLSVADVHRQVAVELHVHTQESACVEAIAQKEDGTIVPTFPLLKDCLPTVIVEAQKQLNGTTMDMLWVTIGGPELPRLLLVDLPGFHQYGGSQQSPERHDAE
jgi:hypothetical protein